MPIRTRSSSRLSSRAPWLAALTAVSACSAPRPPRPQGTVAPPPVVVAVAHDAGDAGDVASPDDSWRGAPLLDRARARVGASVAVAWPGAGGFDDVVAFAGVSRSAGSREDSRVVSWYREGSATPTTTLCEYPVLAFAPTSLATLDVNGDGRVELLAFGERAPVQDGASGSVLVFDLPPDREQPLHLTAASAALDGARDVDQVRARLPLSRGLGLDDIADSSPLSLLGRLSFASPEQLRAVLPREGVEVCDQSHARGRILHRQCRRLTARATDAVLLRDVRRELELVFTESVMTLSCETTARGDACSAQHAAGGQLQEIAFTGAGASRRLARVYSTDYPEAGE